MSGDVTTVCVRMYNVGFGDAFRVTVECGPDRWTMLVDCGVHSAGESRDLSESVAQIIEDLPRATPDGPPRLDVVVATHQHRDHIAGFADPRWEHVAVGEVWLPFVADQDDPDTIRLSGGVSLDRTADRLLNLIDPAEQFLDAPPPSLSYALAANSSSKGLNGQAMDRLLGRNCRGFLTVPRRRFLPNTDPAENTIVFGPPTITAHILGPSRDESMLKRMKPPKTAGWLMLDDDATLDIPGAVDERPLFDPQYLVTETQFDEAASQEPADAAQKALRSLRGARDTMKLKDLATDDAALLGAAAILERAVNNTSLFFVIDIGGLSLLFPGDAQYGAWEHVRGNPVAKALIDNVDFYKVGHHGSHNATPDKFATDEWVKHGDAMVPWGEVAVWTDKIPWPALIEELAHGGDRRIILPESVIDARNGRSAPELEVDTDGRWWTELRYEVPPQPN